MVRSACQYILRKLFFENFLDTMIPSCRMDIERTTRMTETPKPPFPEGAWITEGHYLGKRSRSFRRFQPINDITYGSGYRVGILDATYYRLATPAEIAAEIERLKARIADLESP
jgi:hypothetical protein